ncbi:phage tail domain-containing protein [Anaerovoracaceae bacterium 41-7]
MLTATTFTYAGINSDEYDLMIYWIGDPGTVDEEVWSVDIEEERIPLRTDPIFLGLNANQPLSYEMIIGSKTYIERETVEQIIDWLTSHETYQWLEIDQDDLSEWRYKVIFSNIEMTSVNSMPFSFRCTVTMDSQFAYGYPAQSSYDIQDGEIVSSNGTLFESTTIDNSSTFNGYIYPKIQIEINPGNELSIINRTDNNRTFKISVPDEYVINDGAERAIINVDNKNMIIKCNSDNINIYDTFADEAGNHYFFRLVKGSNELAFKGNAILKIELESIRKVGF